MSQAWRAAQLMVINLSVLATIIVFVIPLQRRSRFGLRLVLSSAAFLAVSYVFKRMAYAHGSLSLPGAALYFLVVRGVVAALSWQSFMGAIYCTVWVLLTQQFLMQLWLGIYQYLSGWGILTPNGWFLAIPWMAVSLVFVYLGLARLLPTDGKYDTGPRQTISAVMLLAVFWMLQQSALAKYDLLYTGSNWQMVLMCEFYCLTILYLQNALFKKSAMQKELVTLNLLHRQQKAQYDLARENIALINQKCHDLKHQVRALRHIESSHERERYLDEIDDSIGIYESIAKTGSDALDTILTEKSLLCKEKRIQIHCVADGSQMGFMDPTDIYAIFGNVLDNAIEEVQKFTDPDKRQIDLLIYLRQRFLIINVTNPLYLKPRFEDDLPLTTKGDDGYHGFGLKSVRHTVQKYDGVLTVSTDQDCFILKILLPLPN